ncbi:site-specific integrase [Saccharopolyspora mangrovi]|uniref:Tyrosine-type recombinase/integrase n=1 Tax=Saccharopolyspora mangrovi TaxID=3082379 RepID=A0ABU6AK50_9PSEU|nr:tyrosine-type recombinase/integrase [Saccharopolyspora sp. S2-29]MEB3371922.1 tyrosine-type recombinase/integrase [Saccharopolyspora sp. S2-29]
MAKGSVTKRCGCSELVNGKRQQIGRKCPKLRRADGTWNPRHGTWGFSISLPGPDGKAKPVTRSGFATQVEAAAELDSLRDQARRGLSAGNRQYMGEYLDQWLATKTDVRPKTVRSYEGHIRTHLRPNLGHLRLDQLRPQHVSEALATVESSDANRQRVRATLRTALSDAVRAGLLHSNPAKLVKLPSGKPPKALVWNAERVERWQETGEIPSPVMVWTPQQAGTFLDETAEDPLSPMFHLIAHVGLRRGEACGLGWEDVDLVNGTITVRISRTVVGNQIIEGPPKSDAGGRTVALDRGTVEVLRDHRKTQVGERLRLGSTWVESGKLFTRPDGSALNPNQVSNRFHALTARAGLPPIRVHDLRHCAATFALAAGVDMKLVQTMLGHSTLAMTSDIYTAVLPEVAREAAERAAGIIPRAGVGTGSVTPASYRDLEQS